MSEQRRFEIAGGPWWWPVASDDRAHAQVLQVRRRAVVWKPCVVHGFL